MSITKSMEAVEKKTSNTLHIKTCKVEVHFITKGTVCKR